jgi:penicillin-insensitive murein endopeptidase
MSKFYARVFFLIIVQLTSTSVSAQSQCYGSVSSGRIKNSVKLPMSGPNFSAYSKLGALIGRTYVHSTVAAIIATSYAEAFKSDPQVVYVYGETGWPSGGRMRPHRTHQNGLSVDFFVPVRKDSHSLPLPTSIFNRLGYDIEFDSSAQYDNYTIDFEAMAEQLYQLHKAAISKGAGIALVIFERSFLPKLFATRHGEYLKNNLPFMAGKPWVRHDEHYHVDFDIMCKSDAR